MDRLSTYKRYEKSSLQKYEQDHECKLQL